MVLDDFLKQDGCQATGDAVADTIEAAAALQSAGRMEIAACMAGLASSQT